MGAGVNKMCDEGGDEGECRGDGESGGEGVGVRG